MTVFKMLYGLDEVNINLHRALRNGSGAFMMPLNCMHAQTQEDRGTQTHTDRDTDRQTHTHNTSLYRGQGLKLHCSVQAGQTRLQAVQEDIRVDLAFTCSGSKAIGAAHMPQDIKVFINPQQQHLQTRYMPSVQSQQQLLSI